VITIKLTCVSYGSGARVGRLRVRFADESFRHFRLFFTVGSVVPFVWGSFASGLNRQVSATLLLRVSVLVRMIAAVAARRHLQSTGVLAAAPDTSKAGYVNE
jgi:hypothetical protein